MSSWEDEEERPTRKQRREQARAQRKAAEAQERASALRRKRLTVGGSIAGAVVIVALVVIISTSGGKGTSGSGVSAGLQTTRAPWAPEGNELGTRVAGLGLPVASEGGYHVHADLRVYVNGKQVPVPAEIGVESGLRGQQLEPLHTHDTMGIIHIESIEQYPFTIGQMFTVWGVKFTNTQLGGYRVGAGNTLSAYVNGKPVKDPPTYVMKPHDNIVVGYGKPGSFPTSFSYNFPPGI